MTTPLFSVLIANYNNGRYIHEAIESVLAQTYQNWEIIIVDDGSSDNSPLVYNQYANHPKIKVYKNEHNSGCGYTKRKLVELSHGELCGFLDADDALLPHALDIMIETHIAHPEVSVVFSRYYQCDKDWNIIGTNRQLSLKEGEDYFTHQDFTPEHFVSFKKAMYNKTDGISPLAKIAEDQDLFFKLEEVAPCFILDNVTYKYRIFSNSASHKSPLEGFYYSTMVAYETCKRRGLSITEYGYLPMKVYYDAYLSRYNCKEYKIGKFILQPLVWGKHLMKSLHLIK